MTPARVAGALDAPVTRCMPDRGTYVGAYGTEHLLDLAEDMADIRAAEAARAEMRETGDVPVPWDDVKAELGL